MKPLLQTSEEFQYYQEQSHCRRDYSKPPTPPEMTQDLNKAHDNIKRLVREKDLIRHALGIGRLWQRILIGAVTAQWALILFLLKYCIHSK